MANRIDRNIDLRLRKPRKSGGTPAHKFGNYATLGIFAIGGLFWAAFELIPAVQEYKRKIREGELYRYPEAFEDKIKQFRISLQSPIIGSVIQKAK